jgi:hypothetical protein
MIIRLTLLIVAAGPSVIALDYPVSLPSPSSFDVKGEDVEVVNNRLVSNFLTSWQRAVDNKDMNGEIAEHNQHTLYYKQWTLHIDKRY